MINFIKKILQRKILAGGVALALLAGGYFGYQTIFGAADAVRYVTAQVKKETFIVSISGSGQVSAANQIDLKAKASGEVLYLGVSNGQAVPRGALIVQLDSRDAQAAVRDAELNLAAAELSLAKTKRSVTNEQKTLKGQVLFSITSAFPVVGNILDDLDEVLFDNIPGQSENLLDYYSHIVAVYENSNFDYKSAIATAYQQARQEYDAGVIPASRVKQDAGWEDLETVLDQTAEMMKTTTDSVRLGYQLLERFEILLADNYAVSTITMLDAAADRDQLKADMSTINASAADIFGIQKSLRTFIDAKSAASPFSVREQELTLRQKQNALSDKKEELANYFIYAPFAGIVSNIGVKKGEPVSANTVIAAIITPQYLAEIPLNEVDVAQVKVGQKATLTFDAIPNLTISGQVAEIDSIGEVSQGVVTYNVKIGFDTQDERIKPAMSVSATIITTAKPGVLLIPNSAVKSQGEGHYVEMVDGEEAGAALAANTGGVNLQNSPRRQTVEIGPANDEFTEVTSGLQEGDYVVARTIQPSSAQSQTSQTPQQSGGLRIPGLTGGPR